MRRASAYPSRPVPLWRNHDYLLLRGGQGVSNFGSAVQGVVTPLLILAISHSPAQAGIAAALGSLPFFLLSLPAGALVDRWDRKRVMIVCDIGRTVATASIPIALWSGHLTVPLLYVVSGISGTFFVFFNLAETSCLPRVVTKEQLPAATSHNEAVDYASFILGRPAGGFLYQTIGQAAPFLANAVSFAVSAVSLLFIRTRFQEDRVPTPRDLRAEITEGLRWLWNQPLIRFMAFLNGGQNLLYSGIGLVIIVLDPKGGRLAHDHRHRVRRGEHRWTRRRCPGSGRAATMELRASGYRPPGNPGRAAAAPPRCQAAAAPRCRLRRTTHRQPDVQRRPVQLPARTHPGYPAGPRE